MKRILKTFVFPLLAAVLFTLISFASMASETSSLKYTVKGDEEGFTAVSGESEISTQSLGELISMIEADGIDIVFDNVSAEESITFKRSCVISGSLTLTGGIICESESLAFNSADIKVSGADIEIRSGSVNFIKSSVSLSDAAITLDRSPSASLFAESSEIKAKTNRGAILINVGSVYLTDTDVKNEYSYAIENYSGLYLGGESDITGYEYGIYTERTAHLTAGGKYYRGEASVIFSSVFERGGFYKAFLDADAISIAGVSVSDSTTDSFDLTYLESSDKCSEKNVAAVSLPYRFSFYTGGELYSESSFFGDETTAAPIAPTLLGYTFKGWKESGSADSFLFGDTPKADTVLFASFSLDSPTYSISDTEFTYDGKKHFLSLGDISHPLLAEGSVSYEWYKNEESINDTSPSVELVSVSDSGAYNCKLTFAYKGDYVTVTTKTVNVKIDKMKVAKPQITPLKYTGYPILPESLDTDYYTAEYEEGTDVGSYPVTLKLTDPENCIFESGEELYEYCVYDIVKAENRFLKEPAISDYYEGYLPTLSFTSLFGECTLYYSSDGIRFDKAPPTEAGSYYLEVVVDETDNYYELRSEIIPFSVLPDFVKSLEIKEKPNKTDYLAFDTVDLEGILLYAVYESGKREEVSRSDISVYYGSGDCILAQDSCVYLSYLGASVPLYVTASRRDYDLSGLVFEDAEVLYNGKRQTISVGGAISGLDGIPLEYEIRGGGIEVGEYEIRIVFKVSSPNYNKPSDEVRLLKISPRPVKVTYTELEFIYDGSPKLPKAEFTAENGASVTVPLSGAATDAGEYTANCILNDPNYRVENPEISFTVFKAPIDLSGVAWSNAVLTYTGELQGVRITELPKGVRVSGYLNASFRDAGKYCAEAVLEYDENNYLPPDRLTYEWQITPAEYDNSGFYFSDASFVYDGKTHYPELHGSMPKGLDGSSPSYEFSLGATHVSEGRVEVTVTFSSGSKNYLAPPAVKAFVTVTPKVIAVTWGSCSFVYDGSPKTPEAKSRDIAVNVTGEGIDAGTYTATASAESTDYRIANPSCEFTVTKAENKWVEIPSVSDIFEGGEINFKASPISGEAVYTLYSDEELTNKMDYPESVGEYYLVAYVPESKNYLQLVSEAMSFSVIPIEAVSLSVSLADKPFFALDTIKDGDIEAHIVNNDGSAVKIEFSSIEITYQSGDALKYGDNKVTFRHGGFEATADIVVALREYDMSGAVWVDLVHTYDGEEKSPKVEGLPEGVTLIGFTLSGAVNSGSYKVSAIFSYDEENYMPPELAEAELVIKKKEISLPTIPDSIYTGKDITPSIKEDPLYTFTAEPKRRAGEYFVKFTPKDPENYTFGENDTASYRILPAPITVTVGKGGSYTATEGELFGADSLFEEYYSEGGYLYLSSSNTDYKITVIPYKEESGIFPLLIIILFVLLMALAVYIFVGKRDILFASVKLSGRKEREPEPKPSAPAPKTPELKTLLEVNESSANRLISDMLAKSLVKEERKKIVTSGAKRYAVNVGRISEAFESGDKIDINTLKAKGIVPKDACYLKILGAGVLDKPLHLMANSFSLGAVKMIALTGGVAERVYTERAKKN